MKLLAPSPLAIRFALFRMLRFARMRAHLRFAGSRWLSSAISLARKGYFNARLALLGPPQLWLALAAWPRSPTSHSLRAI
jgi:hypothetical protein